jgi:hypothetical protein
MVRTLLCAACLWTFAGSAAAEGDKVTECEWELGKFVCRERSPNYGRDPITAFSLGYLKAKKEREEKEALAKQEQKRLVAEWAVAQLEYCRQIFEVQVLSASSPESKVAALEKHAACLEDVETKT